MTFETKFDIGDVVKIKSHDTPPARFFDDPTPTTGWICGAVVGVHITIHGGIMYLIRRDTRDGSTQNSYADWQLELVPTAPTREQPRPSLWSPPTAEKHSGPPVKNTIKRMADQPPRA